MKKTFYSNGKLLITGEYAVLDGAKALALPTKYGQYLHIKPVNENTIKWQSLDADGYIWYEAALPLIDIFEKNTNDNTPAVTKTLIAILHEAHKLNTAVLQGAKGFTVKTQLTFPRQWGLGTSSTLINNIAQWFAIDAYQLLWKSFGGSGYDIACAQHDTAIQYQIVNGKPMVTPVPLTYNFTNKLYFVYLNQKQDSRNAIAAYRDHNAQKNTGTAFTAINNVTELLPGTTTVEAFSSLLEEHETILSGLLGLPTVKQSLFPDFPGTLKSLGAWGGDFILAVADNNPIAYFKDKGYTTVLPFSDMIL